MEKNKVSSKKLIEEPSAEETCKESRQPRTKKLIKGKTLIFIKNDGYLDGKKIELKCYYGNHIEPATINKDGKPRRLVQDIYIKSLKKFLDSKEGSRYIIPTDEEIIRDAEETYEYDLKKMEAKNAQEVNSEVEEAPKREENTSLAAYKIQQEENAYQFNEIENLKKEKENLLKQIDKLETKLDFVVKEKEKNKKEFFKKLSFANKDEQEKRYIRLFGSMSTMLIIASVVNLILSVLIFMG